MKKFTDTAGREWKVEVNVGAVKRVRSLLNIDLLDLAADKGDLIKRLINDPVLLCNTIYVVCRPQAEERGITDEQFGEAMAGDAIEHATTALLEEIVGFTPNPRDRAAAQRVLDKSFEVMNKARDLMEKTIDAEIDTIAAKALASVGLSSGDAQASSD